MMKKSKKILRKILAASVAVTVMGSISFSPAIGSMLGTSVSVSAAVSSPVVTVGNYQYILYSDQTAKVVGYTGTKNLSATNVAMPTVIYSSDIDTTWEYNQYISSYTITQMQAGIFSGCKFKSLSLPRKLQAVIGGFTGAEIGAFFIDDNNSYLSSTYYSGAYALYNKSNTTLYAYPSNPKLYYSDFGNQTNGFPSTLTRIEDKAFASSKLSTVTIPASVTYVGDQLFTGSNVHYVTFEGNAPTFRFLPDTNQPDHGTFEGASGLYQITIKGTGGSYNTNNGLLYNKDNTKLILVPQGKTSAFTIAKTCTEIGDYAFYRCNVDGPVIYDGVKTIGENAFSGVKSNFKVYCLKDTAMDTFVRNHNVPYAYAYEYTTDSSGVTITKYNGPFTSPGVPASINGRDVIAIGKGAFKGNTSLVNVYLYSPIATIGEEAFYGCTKLKGILFPYTLTEVGKYSFYKCSAIVSLDLPSKLKTIGVYAFGNCTSLTELTLPKSVEQLNYSAFYGCSSLSKLTIGSGVKNIGAFAFENTALTSQYIPQNVTFIGNYAFGYSYSASTHSRNEAFNLITGYPGSEAQSYAEENNIPFNTVLQYSINNGEVTIEKYTGSDTVLVIPDTIEGKPVTSIKGYAFNGSKVTSVTLPSGMTSLGGYAFYGASKLTSVVFPSSITSIGYSAFEFCTSLKTITIPSSVKTIGADAFFGCTALSKVTFFSGLESIGYSAFLNTALTSVTIPKTVTYIGSNAFGYTYTNKTYVPVDNFTMTGYAYTAADTYATNNGHIIFKPLYETLVNTSTISSLAVNLGESVTVNASATGGKLPYTYYVGYEDTSGHSTTVQGSNSTNSVVDVTLPDAGTFTIKVNVKDDKNNIKTKTFTVTVTEAPLENLSTVSKAKIGLGESVTLTGKASGGAPSYEYKFYYKTKAEANWHPLNEFSSTSSMPFKPTEAVPYQFCIKVRDTKKAIKSKYFDLTVNPALQNQSTVSKTSVTLGQSVTLTGKASGGVSPYQYKYYYKTKAEANWHPLNDFNSTSSMPFKPANAVPYQVCIKVRDADKVIKSTYFDLTVASALQNKSTVSSTSVTLGQSVTLSGKASGGASPYQYKYYYKTKTEANWHPLNDFNSTSSIPFKPSEAVPYQLCIKVRDNNQMIVNKYFDLTVASALQNKSTVSGTTVTLGQSVTLTGKASGGVTPYEYRYYYKTKAEANWHPLNDFSATCSMPFKPSEATQYRLCIKVRDANKMIVNKYFDLTVK